MITQIVVLDLRQKSYELGTNQHLYNNSPKYLNDLPTYLGTHSERYFIWNEVVAFVDRNHYVL